MYKRTYCADIVAICYLTSSPQASLCETILNNPLGHVIPRSAGDQFGGSGLIITRHSMFNHTCFTPGLPMKLTFFVHPYEVQKRLSLFSSYPSDTEQEHQVDGLEVSVSATVLLESSNKVYNLSTDPNLFEWVRDITLAWVLGGVSEVCALIPYLVFVYFDLQSFSFCHLIFSIKLHFMWPHPYLLLYQPWLHVKESYQIWPFSHLPVFGI